MSKQFFAAVIFTVLSVSLTDVPVQGAIVITEVMSNSGNGGGTGNGDWFEIFNSGSTAIDMTDWSWDDDDDGLPARNR